MPSPRYEPPPAPPSADAQPDVRAPFRPALLVLAAVMAMTVGACGDDDDTADLSYCEALGALADEGAAIGPEADAVAVDSALDLWERVAAAAPPESAAAARVMADAAATVAQDGSDAELDLDGVAQASATLAASAAETCGVELLGASDS